MKELEALKRTLERERKARKASEKILEEKSLELFRTNQELKKLYNSLENRYQRIVEQANDIIYRGDEQGKCTYVNNVVQHILGYSPQELIGKHFSELVIEKEKKEVASFYLKQLFEKVENTYLEFQVTTKSGEIKWLGQNVSIVIEEGLLKGVSAVARDITKQKQAEEEVKRNEEKYKSIIENMELALLEVDTRGFAVSSNTRFTQMTGYTQSDLIGKNPALLLTDEESQKVISEKNKERKRGESSVYEVKCKKKDGSILWLMISGAPRFDKEGNFIGSIGIHMDITHQKQLLQQLEDAKALAEKSSKAKETFLAHMSHEIRTPLNSVLGMTHLLQDTNPTEEQKDYLETIQYSSGILLNIISDILDISKIESGKIEFNESPFDLTQLVKAQQKAFAFRMQEKAVDVTLDLDSTIGTQLIGDKLFINQILMNLLGNASKFTHKGNISIKVKKGREVGEHIFINFMIQDTGIGIAKAQLAQIFESFKQAEPDTRLMYGGTGLGLSISKHLVELHGGNIEVSSTVNEGTTFHVSIPFKKTTIPLSDKHLKDKEERFETDVKGIRVLVAEDNLMNQKFLTKVLEKYEIDYVICDNGKLALDQAKTNSFDLILMDIQMPEMDGYETTLAIRKFNETIPIIALTASALVDERRKVLECGMNEHLSKPFAPHQLIEKIERFIPNSNDLALDAQHLHDFYGDDQDFKAEMFNLFLTNVTSEMEQLKAAIQQNNHELINQIAHKNKSSFAMVGLKEMSNLLKEIELSSQNKSTDYTILERSFFGLLPLAIKAVEVHVNK